MWYTFYDLHTGGDPKTPHELIVVKASSREAAIGAFKALLGVDPERRSCPCCGDDYSITERDTLDEIAECYPGSVRDAFLVARKSTPGEWYTGPAKDYKDEDDIRARLEYLRGEIKAERISYAEIAELQGLVDYIDKDDVELLEAAGVPEVES